jgi:hypothetical protein
LTTRARNLLVLVGLLLIGAGAFAAARFVGRPRAPLDAVPRDAFFVASIDLDAIRASPAGAALMARLSEGAPAVRDLGQGCGIDLLARTHELVLAAPESNDRRPHAIDLGVAARLDLSVRELSQCAAKPAGTAGGAAWHLRTAGSFTVAEREGAGPDTRASPCGRGGPRCSVPARGSTR